MITRIGETISVPDVTRDESPKKLTLDFNDLDGDNIVDPGETFTVTQEFITLGTTSVLSGAQRTRALQQFGIETIRTGTSIRSLQAYVRAISDFRIAHAQRDIPAQIRLYRELQNYKNEPYANPQSVMEVSRTLSGTLMRISTDLLQGLPYGESAHFLNPQETLANIAQAREYFNLASKIEGDYSSTPDYRISSHPDIANVAALISQDRVRYLEARCNMRLIVMTAERTLTELRSLDPQSTRFADLITGLRTSLNELNTIYSTIPPAHRHQSDAESIGYISRDVDTQEARIRN